MKATVLFSGGIDSTTCLAMALEDFGPDNVIPLTIYYGQKHKKELESAAKILDYYNLSGRSLNLTDLFAASSCSLLSHSSAEIPKESYEKQQKISNSAPVSTYVPFRNGLFLSCAASMAISLGCSYIYYGAHSDDTILNAYPDCSTAFHQSMNDAIFEGSGRILKIIAPFIDLTKADIIKKGIELQIPFELTWSCYEGQETACGECATCIDRKLAFEKNNITDPILYRR